MLVSTRCRRQFDFLHVFLNFFFFKEKFNIQIFLEKNEILIIIYRVIFFMYFEIRIKSQNGYLFWKMKYKKVKFQEDQLGGANNLEVGCGLYNSIIVFP